MTSVVPSGAKDSHPPRAIARVLNAVMRVALRTRLARRIEPLALLEFDGRRSGRPYRIPVGWHEVDGKPVVFSPARWRANFSPSLPVTVRHLGTATRLVGTLIVDPDEVTAALRAVLAGGASARSIGMKVPPGHAVSRADVVALDRAMIRLHPS